jgi:hypothetical protein
MRLLKKHFSSGWSRVLISLILISSFLFGMLAVEIGHIGEFRDKSMWPFGFVGSIIGWIIVLTFFVWIRNGFRKKDDEVDV